MLVVQLKYHETDQKPCCCDSWSNGTRPLDLVGSGVASLRHRHTTAADHHPRPMNTIQLVINGNQVEGQIDQIAQILGMVSNTLAQPVAPVVSNEPVELAPFNAFLEVELTPYFGAKGATFIVDKLKLSLKCNNFVYLIPAYKLAKGDLHKRQLLKAVSAVYRYKFGVYDLRSSKYSLKSEIKYAKACDHCGKLAQVLVDRLIAEKLWK